MANAAQFTADYLATYRADTAEWGWETADHKAIASLMLAGLTMDDWRECRMLGLSTERTSRKVRKAMWAAVEIKGAAYWLAAVERAANWVRTGGTYLEAKDIAR